MRAVRFLQRFKRREDGAALVEFALILPPFLLAFFVIVEFSRLFFSYQAAVQGVRDATRYMARITAEDSCAGQTSTSTPSFGTPETGTSGDVFYPIVFRNMATEVDTLLPANVTLVNVKSRIKCVAGAFRDPIVPVAELEAQFRITFPLVGILELNGQPLLDPIDHIVNDESRIYGI
ncbi:TadE/TadG family type IV pilus assembly protein [Kangsaoukella pontilimi]|nr:TadE/TadG family type IV pilus assembly protein [Kangsaoukella pontilimi]